MIAVSPWVWIGFIAFVLAMLALDLGVFHRQEREMTTRAAAAWTVVWVALAAIFCGGLAIWSREAAATFATGYVIEESLSADNIFVMVLIFNYFAIPRICQRRVLFYGILGALMMRGLFIAAGAALLARFAWVSLIFGALLVITGTRMAFKGEEKFEADANPAVKLVRRFVPLTPDLRGRKFFVIENGKLIATPLILVLVVVEFTDLIFAVDSIPAIFGITRNTFLVFTSNIFAVLGLRSLYFLLASMIDRFHLLRFGLAAILTFVGVKMLLESKLHIGTLLSLGVIVGVLTVTVVASLIIPAPSGHPGESRGKG